MIFLMILVIRKIKIKQNRLNGLYMELKNSSTNVNTSSITSDTKSKLDSIINFIEKNYKEDLSRKGLASSVDLSPDFLSRNFKSYTNKKMNTFINELRIKNAAKQLIQTDLRIIDIAFTVGFESLSTFNRKFIEFMNITPTEYRKKNAPDAGP